jgi:hypothetical protein
VSQEQENYPAGTRVKCVAHRGKHRGTVARVVVEGQLYVIAWHGKGTAGAAGQVRVGNVVMKYPKELIESHLLDLTSCEASKVERV